MAVPCFANRQRLAKVFFRLGVSATLIMEVAEIVQQPRIVRLLFECPAVFESGFLILSEAIVKDGELVSQTGIVRLQRASFLVLSDGECVAAVFDKFISVHHEQSRRFLCGEWLGSGLLFLHSRGFAANQRYRLPQLSRPRSTTAQHYSRQQDSPAYPAPVGASQRADARRSCGKVRARHAWFSSNLQVRFHGRLTPATPKTPSGSHRRGYANLAPR